jgi:hypothetical protein
MAKEKQAPQKLYRVHRYPDIQTFEDHLNSLLDEVQREAMISGGNFVLGAYRLQHFNIDTRDGSIVAVFRLG